METWLNPDGAFMTWLMRSSWQASVLVGLILVVQWSFKGRLSPFWRYNLWMLVLVRLVLPIAPESSASLFNLVQIKRVATPVAGRAQIDAEHQTSSLLEPAALVFPVPEVPQQASSLEAQTVPDPATQKAAVQPKQDKISISTLTRGCVLIWLAGVLLQVLRVAWQNVAFWNRLRTKSFSCAEATLQLLERCRREMNVGQSLQLFETPLVKSPALYGFFRPKLLLPEGMADSFAPSELRYVFLHELAHVKRKDMVVNWLMTVLQVLHWLNPMIWLAFSRMRADRELAADALALSYAKDEENVRYGEAIVKLLESLAQPVHLAGLVGILEDRKQMRRRIRMIAGHRKASYWSVPAILIAAALGFTGLTDAQDKNLPSPKASDKTVQGRTAALGQEPGQPKDWKNELLFVAIDAVNSQPLVGTSLKVTCCANGECFLLGHYVSDSAFPVSIRYPGTNASSIAVWVSKEGYVPKLVTWTPRRNDLVDGKYIAKLERGITIGGVVRDEMGKGVPGVKVTLDSLRGIEDPIAREHTGLQGSQLSVLTDENGNWKCSSAPAKLNEVFLLIEHPEFTSATFSIGDGSSPPDGAKHPNQISRKDLLAGTALVTITHGQTLSGRVTDALGRPIAGARVLLGEKHVAKPHIQKADPSGNFTFKNRVPWERNVTVQASGYAPELKRVEDGTTNLTFALKPGGVIKGRAVDEQGNPLEGVIVTVGSAFWRGAQTLDWDTRTDSEGRFMWDSAPEEGVSIGFIKQGYAIAERSFAADGREVTISMSKQPSFFGHVIDKATKETIREFRVTAGYSIEVGPRRDTIWEDFTAVRGRNGDYAMKLDRPMQLLKVEAEGYQPMISRVLSEKDYGQSIDFALEKSSGISGVVVGIDGQAAAGAEVACAGGKFLELGKGKFNQASGAVGYGTILTTDREGRFTLPPEALPTTVIAVAKDGFAAVRLDRANSLTELRLQRWGQIDGVLRIGNRPGTNELVGLSWTGPSDERLFQFAFQDFQAKTDEAGRFTLKFVPPGEHTIVRFIPQGKRSWAHAYPSLVRVQAGQTTQIALGGSGRTIVGKMAFEAETGIDWQNATSTLMTKVPRPPANLKTQQDFQAWSNLPEIKAAYSNRRTYPVILQQDGSFHIDDIPAGSYEIMMRLTDGNGTMPELGRMIASAQHEVTVPEMPGGRSESPLDVGTVQLSAQKPPSR